MAWHGNTSNGHGRVAAGSRSALTRQQRGIKVARMNIEYGYCLASEPLPFLPLRASSLTSPLLRPLSLAESLMTSEIARRLSLCAVGVKGPVRVRRL